MDHKTQKILSAFFIAGTSVFGFQILIYLVNLNQVSTFLQVAFWVWLYLCAMILLFFDLHFKAPGALALAKKRHEGVTHRFVRLSKVLATALGHRLGHYFRIKEVKAFFVYLLLPSFLYWFTVSVFYGNMGQARVQQLYAWISTGAMVAIFWYLKEAFHRKQERVDSDIFVAFSVAKIYTLTLAFGAGLELIRRYCLDPRLYAGVVFSVSFLLIYQALFQHNFLKARHLATALAIAFVMGVLGYFVYLFWSYNFFSAAIFMAAFYNFFWGTYHYHLDYGLNRKVFFEILAVCLAVAFVIFANTNFKERILGSCF